MSDIDLPTSVALLTPLFIQLVLYGILLPIFFVAMRTLLTRNSILKTRKTKWFFAAVAIIMFLIATSNIVVGIWTIFILFFFANPQIESKVHTSVQVRLITRDFIMMHWITVWYVKDLIAAVQILLGDGMLVRTFLRLDT
jgi:hypothetical protein